MGNNLEYERFEDINLQDDFFNSLKEDYCDFEQWFNRKRNNKAFVHYEGNKIDGFLFFKLEDDNVTDVEPPIYAKKIVKIGTFKINPHGTRLGERFIKKALDFAISENADLCYLTIFEKHEALIKLLTKYGFMYSGIKKTSDGEELVLVKNLKTVSGNIVYDYPLINTNERRKFLISIYPQYHSAMFPDSILKNEDSNIISDVTYTNSIHKIYVCRMNDIRSLRKGDILVIYRTKSEGRSAEYSSVATSICIVEKVRNQNEFTDFEEFYNYASRYSIFDKEDLEHWYSKGGCYIIKMLYNAALKKRPTRKTLIEKVGLDRDIYWGFTELTDEQFERIIEVGEIDEGIIIY